MSSIIGNPSFNDLKSAMDPAVIQALKNLSSMVNGKSTEELTNNDISATMITIENMMFSSVCGEMSHEDAGLMVSFWMTFGFPIEFIQNAMNAIVDSIESMEEN
jgi:hypothetical protein